MAKVPGFAKAFAGRWRIAAGFSQGKARRE